MIVFVSYWVIYLANWYPNSSFSVSNYPFSRPCKNVLGATIFPGSLMVVTCGDFNLLFMQFYYLKFVFCWSKTHLSSLRCLCTRTRGLVACNTSNCGPNGHRPTPYKERRGNYLCTPMNCYYVLLLNHIFPQSSSGFSIPKTYICTNITYISLSSRGFSAWHWSGLSCFCKLKCVHSWHKIILLMGD